MNETSKAEARRTAAGWYEKYLKGKGLDIGCGLDPLINCDPWDKGHGDAQFLEGVKDEEYDFVYSSHCLEHMVDPWVALWNWWRVLKPGGYLVVSVPDEDLYEQNLWPSGFNSDHKWSFTPFKQVSWCERSVNVIDLIRHLRDAELELIQRVDTGYDHSFPAWEGTAWHVKDQTLTGAEAAVEFIVRKSRGTPGTV